MGGKSGGGARTPTIEKNTLHGANRSKHVDLISSGEIFGFEHGNDEPLKSIYLNDTPIQNQDGTLNFSGVRVEYNRGSVDQDYLPSFTSIDRNIDVGAQVKKNVPVTRSVSNTQVTSVRVTAGVDALMRTTKEGDQLKTSVSMTIMLMKDNQIYTSKLMTLNEKGSKPFRLDFEFNDLPTAPFEIRCVRNTEDSNDDMLRNNTYFFNYVESIDAKMSYPLSAVVGIEIDAEQFGNNSTTRTYGVKGAIVQVPSNYDPVKRTYSGLWDRLFKPAYTNNPAWVFHDLLTNEVDGFGSKFKGFKVDIDTLYQLSKYCDELVDDGKGGKEPRFVCNAVIMGDDAYKVLYDVCSIFRGVPSYNGQLATTYYDRKSDVTAIYTNSNVIDGLFEYGQVERDKQYNQIQVQYVDQDNGYEATIVEVSDDDHIAKNGINSLSTVAFGQTKESYALRSGSWTLVTSLTETETVSFGVGDQGIKHEVYDIIQIADNDYIGTTLGARIKAVGGAKITLDRELNHALKFSIETIDGPQNFTVKRQISANEYELDKAPLAVEMAQCTAILEEVAPRLFRCLSIEENDDKTYTITAIQHNSQKEAIVDKGAQYVPENTTVINPLPSLSNGIADNDGRAIILRWDSLTVIGTSNTYRIQLFRDKALYQTFETNETFLKLENLPQGEYVAKVRAINERGQFSEELVIAFSTSYKISGLRAKGVVFGIELNWEVPPLITSDAHTEIWFSDVDDRQKARKMAVVTYPQSHYSLSGLSIGDELYFWFRLVDADGNQGEFTHSIKGEPSKSADDIKGYLEGQITTKELSSEVVSELISEALAEIKLDESFREEIINDAINDIQENVDQIISESELIESINKKIGDAELEQRLLELSKSSGDGAIFAETQINRLSIDNAYSEIILQKVSQATSDKQLASQYLSLLVENERAKAELMLSQIAQTTDSKALVQEISSLTASFLRNTASIDSLKEATATEFDAQAQSIEKIKTDVEGNTASIDNVKKTTSDLSSSTAQSFEKVSAEIDNSIAESLLANKSKATSDGAFTQDIASLSAGFLSNTASIDSLKETTATEFKATAKELSKLEASTAKNSAAITQNSTSIATTDGYVNSQYTLTTETTINGEKYVSGFTSKQDGETSEFVVQADKFAIVNKRNGEMQTPFIIASNKMFFNGDMIATGSISGDKLVANTVIKSPKIEGGSLDIGKGKFKVSEHGAVDIRADATKNVGLRITNDRIDVYDENGNLRVRMGRLK